jgi:acylphosphatase
MIIHKNITVYGMVQGVGFRFSARNAARKFAVMGFVKNLPDGSVYIEAEGPESNVSQLIDWCWRGPSHSLVDDVEVTDGDIKSYDTFDIRF